MAFGGGGLDPPAGDALSSHGYPPYPLPKQKVVGDRVCGMKEGGAGELNSPPWSKVTLGGAAAAAVRRRLLTLITGTARSRHEVALI
eukprot:1195913-Prorocentrum_minimum.AAC.12